MEHFDVVIVGAGLSGIGAACHLETRCPSRTYTLLEGRESLGGTWDLFRYPGIRSDSDMFTLGYSFKPWREQQAIADGDAILRYLHETAREYGVDRHIRFSHHVCSASWSSAKARWTVEVEQKATGERLQYTCGFLFVCSGYYDYDEGHTPEFPGIDRFGGDVVHPQDWTGDVAYAGRRVVIIGSGATAVTLLPELARDAAHVTLLQRSPTYMISRPRRDAIADGLRRRLPPRMAYRLVRWKNVLASMSLFSASRRFPGPVKRWLVQEVGKQLDPSIDVQKHFTPYYNPWDQRLCLVPDGDLFIALNEGRASICTDHIETFTETGLRLRSGRDLEADLIVTATGLKVKFMGGIQLQVDGNPVRATDSMCYKSMMFSGIPNLALTFGYTNASWTLKCDLTCEYVCRLLNHMKAHGYRECVPRLDDPSVQEAPFYGLTSGYVQRARHLFPKQGNKSPWRIKQNYAFDVAVLRGSRLDDGVMQFR